MQPSFIFGRKFRSSFAPKIINNSSYFLLHQVMEFLLVFSEQLYGSIHNASLGRHAMPV